MRDEERMVRLRELVRRLQATPPSPNRDKLLERTRLRLVEIERHAELDPPTSHPALPWPSDAPPLNRRHLKKPRRRGDPSPAPR
jgi:hypothetical protein